MTEPRSTSSTSRLPRLLDLFCCAGGAGMGYSRAGFEVVGVDIDPQPNYPFEFVQADALEVLQSGSVFRFDAIHASPPCPFYSTATRDHDKHPDLVGPVRELLVQAGLPYVIENVVGAPLDTGPLNLFGSGGVMLCGSMFGMDRVRRHRLFESSVQLPQMACRHPGERPYTITGHLHRTEQDYPHSLKPTRTHALELMGTPWMTWQECVECIPPAYTEWIGTELLAQIEVAA